MIEQYYGDVCYLQFQHYHPYPELIHGVFTRRGGHSKSPYHSLNTLGNLKGGDHLPHVVSNRQLVLRALALEEMPCVTLWNIHGADVAVFERSDPWRTDWANLTYFEQHWTAEYLRKGDAIITHERGVALALSFADCTPITFYDPVQQVIGIAHGGWRGTARGVVLATIDAMQERFGCLAQDLRVGIGPAIGPCCYEVSEQVRQLFIGQEQFEVMPTAPHYQGLVRESAVFTTVELPGRQSLRLDLWQTTYNQLISAGILPAHIEQAALCTSCHKELFFSHRAEHGKTGRFPTLLALRP